MKTTDTKQLQKIIFRRYFRRFFVAILLFTAILIALFILGLVLRNLRIWYTTDLFYYPLLLIKENPILVFLACWAGGVVFLLIAQWRGIARDMVALAGAIRQMGRNPDASIELPDTLREVQFTLQNIQYENLRNQQIAAEADQRKSDMVVYLAHDLKTPLTSVLGYLSLLRDEQDISPETRQKYLDVATDKAQRLEDLINEFFDITRFSLKGLTLQPTRFNFSRLLEQVADEFRPLFTPKNLTAALHIQPDIEMVADAGKLQRVADNLLRNAISYSYPGTEIRVDAEVQNGQVVLRVKNHGGTIPPHKLAHVFEQFYRVDAARSGDEGGSGLGLAIAKEIVELHGGSITAFSENEQILFTVTVPLQPPPASHVLSSEVPPS